ncbi:phosphotransferase [Frankia sp. Cr1]|uniref:phosphotransferase n=1 Tax=Frankia sp. Cr1 TaxID=3073931 RepID=UPI002AD46285|nr:phosphotransferase [Frankia sp. Cr1]
MVVLRQLAVRHLHEVLPSVRFVEDDECTGTNCVIFRLGIGENDVACRFEPAVEPVSRDGRVRAALCEVAPHLTAYPVDILAGADPLVDTPVGPYRFVFSEWLKRCDWPADLAASERLMRLGKAVGSLHLAIDRAGIGKIVCSPPPMVYWDTQWLTTDEATTISNALGSEVGTFVFRATMMVAEACEARPEPEPCHGDLHGENVFLSLSGPRFLDFDFCRMQPLGRALDVGTLLHRSIRRELQSGGACDPLELSTAFLAGYGQMTGPMPPLPLVLFSACLESARKWWYLGHRLPPGIGDAAYWEKVRDHHGNFLVEMMAMFEPRGIF